MNIISMNIKSLLSILIFAGATLAVFIPQAKATNDKPNSPNPSSCDQAIVSDSSPREYVIEVNNPGSEQPTRPKRNRSEILNETHEKVRIFQEKVSALLAKNGLQSEKIEYLGTDFYPMIIVKCTERVADLIKKNFIPDEIVAIGISMNF